VSSIDTVKEYTNQKSCCISNFNLFDHGGGGVQKVGEQVFSSADAKTLCDSLCDNATVTFYGCNVGNPDAKNPFQAINRLLENCPKVKTVKACMTFVNSPMLSSEQYCDCVKNPSKYPKPTCGPGYPTKEKWLTKP